MAWGKGLRFAFFFDTYGRRGDCFDSIFAKNKKRPAFVLAVLWSQTESLEYLISPSLKESD